MAGFQMCSQGLGGSYMFSHFLRMCGWMDGWFSKLKVLEKSAKMEVTSEGLEIF